MIELRRVDTTIVVTLAAGRANALDGAVLAALVQAIDAALADKPRALVITGEGTSFCAGLALPQLIDLDRAAVHAVMTTFTVAMRRVLEAPVPVIAAINGGAIAGGCVLALMADERIMVADGAKGPPKIGLTEAQLGIGLPAIVTEPVRHKLPHAAHVPVALEGRLFDPVAAQRIGLVDEVVAADRFEARVLERAAQLATAGTAAFAQIKHALQRPMLAAIDQVDDAAIEAWLDTWASAEGQQRMRAAVARLTKK